SPGAWISWRGGDSDVAAQSMPALRRRYGPGARARLRVFRVFTMHAHPVARAGAEDACLGPENGRAGNARAGHAHRGAPCEARARDEHERVVGPLQTMVAWLVMVDFSGATWPGMLPFARRAHRIFSCTGSTGYRIRERSITP